MSTPYEIESSIQHQLKDQKKVCIFYTNYINKKNKLNVVQKKCSEKSVLSIIYVELLQYFHRINPAKKTKIFESLGERCEVEHN